MQETWVQTLGWENALEKEMATHSNILSWEIPWTEEPGGYSPAITLLTSFSFMDPAINSTVYNTIFFFLLLFYLGIIFICHTLLIGSFIHLNSYDILSLKVFKHYF